MHTRLATVTSILLSAVACGPQLSPDSTLDSGESARDSVDTRSSARAVSNPGFAFVDVDGDLRYEATVDHPAVHAEALG